METQDFQAPKVFHDHKALQEFLEIRRIDLQKRLLHSRWVNVDKATAVVKYHCAELNQSVARLYGLSSSNSTDEKDEVDLVSGPSKTPPKAPPVNISKHSPKEPKTPTTPNAREKRKSSKSPERSQAKSLTFAPTPSPQSMVAMSMLLGRRTSKESVPLGLLPSSTKRRNSQNSELNASAPHSPEKKSRSPTKKTTPHNMITRPTIHEKPTPITSSGGSPPDPHGAYRRYGRNYKGRSHDDNMAAVERDRENKSRQGMEEYFKFRCTTERLMIMKKITREEIWWPKRMVGMNALLVILHVRLLM